MTIISHIERLWRGASEFFRSAMETTMAMRPLILILLLLGSRSLFGDVTNTPPAAAGTDTPAEAVKRQLCRLTEAQRAYMARTGHVASELSELVGSEDSRQIGLGAKALVDPWGTKLRYQMKGGIMTSAGPDRAFGTKDDLSIISYNYRGTTGKIRPETIQWNAEPGGPANRGQPVGAGTNGTPAAAGPGG